MTKQPRSHQWSCALGVLFLVLAAGLGIALSLRADALSTWSKSAVYWGWLCFGLATFVGIMFIQSGWKDERSAALLRLDWFLPAIKRTTDRTTPAKSISGRLIRTLAFGLQSNWKTKQRGNGRKFLRSLGLSWVASPVRRFSQATCFVLFCWLFLYVCWPYHAQPHPVQDYGDFAFVAFDQETGEATFQSVTADASLVGHDRVFLRPHDQEAIGDQSEVLLGEFAVVNDSTSDLRLKPIGELNAMLMDVITGLSDARVFTASDRDPFAWPDHYASSLEGKEFVPAEFFLMIDPLVSLSTAIASRSWVWSLSCAGAILLVCFLIPRGFCGYVCPLGTTIDLFDWAITKRTRALRVPADGWWVHIKYYLLATILFAACSGILISGFFSAIPVVTRGFLFLLDPLQSGITRGWHLVPGMHVGHFFSIALFVAVLGLGFFQPRFWCKYVCPSGAVFSLGNLFRLTERKVESSCIHCNKCVEICPFDAIKPDFTTRTTDCTLCQSCAGVCPTHAIKFVERTNVVELKIENEPPTHETTLGRRGFLSLASGAAASLVGTAGVSALYQIGGKNHHLNAATLPVRPPGSVPEKEFFEMCIRCGECFKACPNNVLQAEGFQQGLEGLWTPLVEANWAGCESSCNACGQVCPTGAIRALPLEEKRYARMGLAVVNETTCLPFAGKEACDLCVQECNAAGYNAIEYTQVGVEVDPLGLPIEGTGYAAPVVLNDLCVGCGLCQTRCYAINVKERGVLTESAIIVEVGEGKEDRIMTGSYKQLSDERRATNSIYAPDNATSNLNTTPIPPQPAPTDDPFGVDPAKMDDSNPF